MAQKQQQQLKTHPYQNTSNEDDDRPRSILKAVPSIDVVVASPTPTFAQGMYDSGLQVHL